MKKLAIALAALGAFAIATPTVFACDGHGDKAKTEAPKTAKKEGEKKKAPEKKKDEKKDEKKTEKKDGDKVSMK